LPAAGEMAFNMLVWLVDTAMVGHLGADALSAVGLAGTVYFGALLPFVACLGTGVTALVAQAWGAGKHLEVERTTGCGLIMAALVGLSAAGLILLGAPYAYLICRLPGQVSASGAAYLRVVGCGTAFSLVGIVGNGALRGTGDTRTPMLVAGAANAVNILGDYLLIYGVGGLPALGVKGAALASLVAQVCTGWLTLACLRRRRLGNPPRPLLSLSTLRLDRSTMGRLVGLSLPAGLEGLLMDGGRTLNTFFYAGLGTSALAASQVATCAESMAFMPASGLAVAATVLAGQASGARDRRRMKEEIRQTLYVGLAGALIMGALFRVSPGSIVGLFTEDASVLALAAACLGVAALSQPLISYAEIGMGALRGMGDTRTPMVITAGTMWLVCVPLTFYLVHLRRCSIVVAWWIMVLEWGCRAAGVAVAYRRAQNSMPYHTPQN